MGLVIALPAQLPVSRSLALDDEVQPLHGAVRVLARNASAEKVLNTLDCQSLRHVLLLFLTDAPQSLESSPPPTPQPGSRQPTANVGAQRTKNKGKSAIGRG